MIDPNDTTSYVRLIASDWPNIYWIITDMTPLQAMVVSLLSLQG